MRNISDPLVFLIGSPFRGGIFQIRVTHGKIDESKTNKNLHGFVHTDAPGLPGGSGGPGVDREGKVVGVVSYLEHDEVPTRGSHPYGQIYRAEITGSILYPMVLWGGRIEEALRKHQARLQEEAGETELTKQ